MSYYDCDVFFTIGKVAMRDSVATPLRLNHYLPTSSSTPLPAQSFKNPSTIAKSPDSPLNVVPSAPTLSAEKPVALPES